MSLIARIYPFISNINDAVGTKVFPSHSDLQPDFLFPLSLYFIAVSFPYLPNCLYPNLRYLPVQYILPRNS